MTLNQIQAAKTCLSEKGLNIHIGKYHKLNLQTTPEKECSEPLLEKPVLTLTLNNVDREKYDFEDSTAKS